MYHLERWVWTEADFEEMGWHDSRIHAIAFLSDETEMVFDIDYIWQWVHPSPDETHFNFWVSAVTLVFEGVYDVEFDLGSYLGGLQIDSIRREQKANLGSDATSWSWTIECQEGAIAFCSQGYKQYIRTAPVFGESQSLPHRVRGVSFVRGRTDDPRAA